GSPRSFLRAPPHVPQRAVEKMPDRLLARLSIREDDVLHLVIALEQADRAPEERLRESREHHVRRIIAQHLGHGLVEDFAVDLLEAQEIVARELGAMALVESIDDIR